MHNRLFVDMDGTIARFHDEVSYLERMWEKGFFLNLKSFEEAVQAIKFLYHENKFEIYILSVKINSNAETEKNKWLDNYLPEIDLKHRIFCDVGVIKSLSIPNGVSSNDFLYDDYNVNLNDWKLSGGYPIKCINNINHKWLVGELWKGLSVNNMLPPKVISYKISSYIQDLSLSTEVKIIDDTTINDSKMEATNIFDDLRNCKEKNNSINQNLNSKSTISRGR